MGVKVNVYLVVFYVKRLVSLTFLSKQIFSNAVFLVSCSADLTLMSTQALIDVLKLYH